MPSGTPALVTSGKTVGVGRIEEAKGFDSPQLHCCSSWSGVSGAPDTSANPTRRDRGQGAERWSGPTTLGHEHEYGAREERHGSDGDQSGHVDGSSFSSTTRRQWWPRRSATDLKCRKSQVSTQAVCA